MNKDTTIFRPRVIARKDLQPSREVLDDFLELMNKQGALMPFVKGLARLRLLLIDIVAFEERRRLDPWKLDINDRMVYGVLLHTRFVNEELLQAVTLFFYHLRTLASLDLESPAEFIAAAERTMKKLSRRKIDHALRMVRLTEMINERKKMITSAETQRAQVTAELRSLAWYVQDNLVAIEVLCRKAIVILVQIGLEKRKEGELIEDIGRQFSQELDASIDVRQLTGDAAARAKHVVDRMTQKLSKLIRDDVFHLSQLFEVIHERVQAAAKDLGGLLTGEAGMQGRKGEDSIELFQRMGEVLATLIVDYPRELRPRKATVDATTNALVLEKRREMVDHLLEQVGIERRKRLERRTTQDRRKRKDQSYPGPERRVLRDRRTRAGRRVS